MGHYGRACSSGPGCRHSRFNGRAGEAGAETNPERTQAGDLTPPRSEREAGQRAPMRATRQQEPRERSPGSGAHREGHTAAGHRTGSPDRSGNLLPRGPGGPSRERSERTEPRQVRERSGRADTGKEARRQRDNLERGPGQRSQGTHFLKAPGGPGRSDQRDREPNRESHAAGLPGQPIREGEGLP